MLRTVVLTLALLTSTSAQVTKKVPSWQVCGNHINQGVSAYDAAAYFTVGLPPWSTITSAPGAAIGRVTAGACPKTGTEIGTLIQSCSPDAWQPVVVKVACTVGAGGTCPNANAVPTAAAVKAFCQGTGVTNAPATVNAVCEASLVLASGGKYQGHTLLWDYPATVTYQALQGAYKENQAFIQCVFWPTVTPGVGKLMSGSGKFFKDLMARKYISAIQIATTRLTQPGATDADNFIANAAAAADPKVPTPAAISWQEQITVTYLKNYWSLNYL